jgi:hypothetical protein
MMNAVTVTAKRPVFRVGEKERRGQWREDSDRRERRAYKDEDAFRVSLPVLRECCVFYICLGKVNGPQLAGCIAL